MLTHQGPELDAFNLHTHIGSLAFLQQCPWFGVVMISLLIYLSSNFKLLKLNRFEDVPNRSAGAECIHRLPSTSLESNLLSDELLELQHRGIRRYILLQPKHLIPVFPLFGMLTIALGLAGVTAVRQLAISPTVIVDKNKRSSEILPEMVDPEGTHKKGKQFLERSPLYLASKDHMRHN
ncbi:hypothetical protein R1flu_012089 [Riccia fluitans]|uniref:Uncharacterized protein n=1 Tax=Riccia fluitans TaxID=41844 RepID=A0ABD1Z9L9_9MARC